MNSIYNILVKKFLSLVVCSGDIESILITSPNISLLLN